MLKPVEKALKSGVVASRRGGKAPIAGLVSALCGWEDMGLAIKTYAVLMAGYLQDIKLVLCLTEGACKDAELGREMCLTLRGKVHVTGILWDHDDMIRGYVAGMFGDDRLIACRSEELPHKLGNILRASRGI